MFTPQQIEQVSFGTATFNGYDKRDVDGFLEPLTEDYITLYKENALLKSKMRVLVSKLEEYRQNEASIKEAIVDAQNTCDTMVKETEAKCAQMLNEANLAAAETARLANARLEEENTRIEEAHRTAVERIDEMERQLSACIQALEYIKQHNRPSELVFQRELMEQDEEKSKTDAVAEEISKNLAAMMGTDEEPAPKEEPQHPDHGATRKFDRLQFGPDYDPTR